MKRGSKAKDDSAFCSPTIKAIIDLMISHFQGCISSKSHQALDSVAVALQSYLTEKMSFNDLSQTVFNLVGNCRPLEHLKAVVDTGPDPIPCPDDIATSEGGARRRNRTWTPYEDQRLLAGILKNGIENWTPISKFVGNGRTRSQCSQRWYRGLNPKISKEQWSQEEEAKLMKLVEELGTGSWTKIAAKMGNRSDVQCRYRYKQLSKECRKDSGDEDRSFDEGYVPYRPPVGIPEGERREQFIPMQPICPPGVQPPIPVYVPPPMRYPVQQEMYVPMPPRGDMFYRGVPQPDMRPSMPPMAPPSTVPLYPVQGDPVYMMPAPPHRPLPPMPPPAPASIPPIAPPAVQAPVQRVDVYRPPPPYMAPVTEKPEGDVPMVSQGATPASPYGSPFVGVSPVHPPHAPVLQADPSIGDVSQLIRMYKIESPTFDARLYSVY